MENFEYIKTLIQDRLNGDERRLLELFQDEVIFNELVLKGMNSDWFHYTPKTFDGSYFVKSSNGFEVYRQDRGTISDHHKFETLVEAARHFYKSNGYNVQ